MPLLGPNERSELEPLVLEKLVAYWDARGSAGLLVPGVSVVVDASGPYVAAKPAEDAAVLASIEVRTLFTAVCYLSADGPGTIPREALASLASEATSAVATQVNRIAPE